MTRKLTWFYMDTWFQRPYFLQRALLLVYVIRVKVCRLKENCTVTADLRCLLNHKVAVQACLGDSMACYFGISNVEINPKCNRSHLILVHVVAVCLINPPIRGWITTMKLWSISSVTLVNTLQLKVFLLTVHTS